MINKLSHPYRGEFEIHAFGSDDLDTVFVRVASGVTESTLYLTQDAAQKLVEMINNVLEGNNE